VKRRTFIVGLGSAGAWPVVARAQQGDRMRRIGVLMNGAATGSEFQSYLAAFIQGLRQLGWTDGQNLRIDVRWNASDAILAQTYAAELAGLTPDVIVAASTVNLIPVVQIARTVPIVFVGVADPVAQGFVASVGRPGGNLTGFSQFEFSLGGKWLDLLKQAAPSLTRVAVMFNPDTGPYSKFFMPVIEAAAVSLRGDGRAGSCYRRHRTRFGKFRASAERWADAAGRQLRGLAPIADRQPSGPSSPAVDLLRN
jgi:putative ABC transport system substrate-binding protein